jgi:hypothetical protein
MTKQTCSCLLHLAALMLFGLLAGCLPAAETVDGVLHGDLTWSDRVYVDGDVILAPDAHLTITPGTEVIFLPVAATDGSLIEHPHFAGSELIVQGLLTAEGSAEAPIIFRALDPQAPAGSWGAINIEGSRQSIFKFCVFRQADSAIHSRDSATVYIEESLFEQNLVGVRFNTSEILVENNLLRNNDVGIRFHFGAPVICNNRFEAGRVNLFITSHPTEYHIENNVFGPVSEYQVVLGENVPEDVALSRNYWGGIDAEAVIANSFDGHRLSYLGKLQVAPILGVTPRLAGPTWNP